ncbi:fibronectin type III domain-containing protein, partial [Candidatus Sumerlaeota bacterium]|nr:fibronectin type III domain-containing protein [Candidatus Sumerlaeota bacterium]
MTENNSKLRMVLCFLILAQIAFTSLGVTYPYDGQVNRDVRRDRIIAICEDYASLFYYVGSQNIDYSSYWGATCPDPTIGWKTGMKYCWGGEDTTRIYLARLGENDGAGNMYTSSGSSFDQFCTGTDCSGMASVAWTSPRYSTSGFPNISDDIAWEDLRMGDATNKASSHIRIFDYFVGDINTIMFYENTSGGGLLWKDVHRSLARDLTYQPIRYNNPSGYKVVVYPEPVITYIRRTGVERAELRWDGEADLGFRLYQSANGVNWSMIRNYNQLVYDMRTCDISGLLPDTTYFFKMTAVNGGETETIVSSIASFRIDGFPHRLLIVDGFDRYRTSFSMNHDFVFRCGSALGIRGVGYDFCSNEAVVDEQVDLLNYEAVLWILGNETTIDETFSWPEQMHVMNYLENNGRLFVSGEEIGWDLDERADYPTYKNGSVNDLPFYNDYLMSSLLNDDANTFHVTGEPGSIFDGLDFYFDDGTQGSYMVEYPDVITPLHGASIGLNYPGAVSGAAGVYNSSPTTGTLVYLGFPFETIYPESARHDVMKATINYFDLPVQPPTIQSVIQTAADSVTVTWDGHASEGFRLFQKTGSGSWLLILDEISLDSDSASALISGLSENTLYAFKLQSVNSSGASADSDVLCASLG